MAGTCSGDDGAEMRMRPRSAWTSRLPRRRFVGHIRDGATMCDVPDVRAEGEGTSAGGRTPLTSIAAVVDVVVVVVVVTTVVVGLVAVMAVRQY